MPMPSQIERGSNETAKAELQSIKSNANYEYVCRCCLKSDANFVQLDTLMVPRNLETNDESDQIPLLRCLLFCIRTDNAPKLPQLICRECSKSLQITYYFLQNALRAHEILCRKFCPEKPSRPRLGALLNGNVRHETPPTEVSKSRSHKSGGHVRHECKICGTVVHNRMELKQHIRLHRDTIIQNCTMCIYSTVRQSSLVEHYELAHNLTPAQAVERINLEQRDQKLQESSKVCTLEDIEMLIPTVLTPEDYAEPKSEYNIEQHLATNKETSGNNVSIGTEFLVLPDGSLQQINGGGVLIEYIDDSKRNVAPTGNLNLQTLLGSDNISLDPMDIDIDELIVEDNLPQINTKARPTIMAPSTFKHKCKLCTKSFPTLARLKSHQLTHSNLPKFHCDQCSFFTLLSSDLANHHRDMHQKQEEQLPPSAEDMGTFSCDLCLYETRNSSQLRDHYTLKHMVRPTEVQLRPSWNAEEMDTVPQLAVDRGQNTVNTFTDPPAVEPMLPETTPDIIMQQQQQPQQQHQEQPAQAKTTATLTPMGDISVVVDATPLFFPNGSQTAVTTTTPLPQDSTVPPIVENNGNNNTFSAFPEISASETEQALPPPIQNPNLPSTSANSLIFGDMQDFIDNTDVAAICTIPADGMPVVDGDDIVIDNNNISLDFDAENLFGEFEEDEDGGEPVVDEAEEEEAEEEEEEEEDADNDDENDNNDDATDQNLLLTSDDDDVDDFDDEQSRHLQKPYCIYCNKKFTSQYKFENHMFVHRGLAPYRCELCTNLYNMKRLLIRHYKTVHKRMPTRDMVQAKGDKISVARSNKETINANVKKDPMLMCAKCPFECELDAEMKKHLNAHHGINDGVSVHANEVFIIRKLPFECPRCIRSFAAKRTLTRHLQRSHLVDTIIELTNPAPSTSPATSAVATETMLTSHAEDTENRQVASMAVAADTSMAAAADTSMAAAAGGEIDVGECETSDKIVNNGTTEAVAEGEAVVNEPTAVSASTSLATFTTEAKITTPTPTTTTTITAPAASPTVTTASSSSTIFNTPTHFDFDYDFMGDGTSTPNGASNNPDANPSTTTNNNNNNNNNTTTADGYTAAAAVEVLPSHVLNGSDKLLTAATMEPSPIKDGRTRLPRTPIYVCKLCNKTFDELGKLVKHEAELHSGGEPRRIVFQHKCATCHATFRTLTLLKFHMKRHLARRFQCNRCSKCFIKKMELERHMLMKHVETKHEKGKEKALRCSLDGCTKTFSFKHHLVRHQNAVHLKIRHICSVCGQDLGSSFNLRAHMRVHSGNGQSYKCPNCERTYVRRGPLRQHARQAHQVELKESDWAKMLCNNLRSSNSLIKKARKKKSAEGPQDGV